MRRALGLAVLALALAAPAGAQAAGCPTAPDPAALPTAAQLRDMNSFVAKLGARPTGSPAQAAYIDWIRRQLQAVPGISMTEQSYTINRWAAQSVSLSLVSKGRATALPLAGAVPYSRPTGPGGVTAPLAFVADGDQITSANSNGRIVVRNAPAGSVPNYDFLLPVVSWMTYDPGNTIDPSANFYGDFINYNKRVADLRDAAAAGAKGILFLKDLPRRQLAQHDEPYEGTPWGVAGAFLGADESKRVRDTLAADPNATARLTLDAGFSPVQTPSVYATLPGMSPQRIVIDSHTDGTNAVEDNGPVAMVAMARYLAALPTACRPRTIEFTFSTAHFYQRVAAPDQRYGGAGVVARQLDADYDKGTVSSVVVLEHLGAIDYEGVQRRGGPGQVLEPNGLRAIQFIAVTPSPALVGTVADVVRSHDMQRTIMLQGADAPGSTVPSHCSFGGEGTPFNVHLLPTIGVIAAPQTLYDPAFGLEGIDFGVMHSELLGYTELVNRLGTMDQAAVAGEIPAERAQRAAGAASCPREN